MWGSLLREPVEMREIGTGAGGLRREGDQAIEE